MKIPVEWEVVMGPIRRVPESSRVRMNVSRQESTVQTVREGTIHYYTTQESDWFQVRVRFRRR